MPALETQLLRHDDSFDLLGLDFAPPAAASTVEKPKVWSSVRGCLGAWNRRVPGSGVFFAWTWLVCRNTRWGPQDSVQLVYKWLNSMVYGRYNELVNGD